MNLPLDNTLREGQSGMLAFLETLATTLNGLAAAADGDVVTWDAATSSLEPTTKAALATALAGEAGLAGAFVGLVTGVVGDGTTDDTAAIQAAIDAAGAAGGGRVVLPAGDFAVTGLDMDSDRVHLIGAGRHASALKAVTGISTDNVVTVTGAYCSVRDLTINGNDLGGDCLRLDGGAIRFVGHNLWLMKAGAAGVHASGTTQCHASQWTDIGVIDCATYGVQMGTNAYDSQWSNLWVGQCNIGLTLTSGEHSFANIHLWGCTSHGADVDSSGNRFVNGYIETNGGDGVNLDAAAEFNRFVNLELRANTGSAMTGGSGTLVDGVMTVRMTSTHVRNGTTTFANVTGMVLPVEAGTIYEVDLTAFYMSSQTADLKLRFTLPTGATLLWGAAGLSGGATSNFGIGDMNATAPAESSFIHLGGATTSYPLLAQCKGILTIGSTAGTAQLQMGQVSSDATDTTLMANTTLRLTPIA